MLALLARGQSSGASSQIQQQPFGVLSLIATHTKQPIPTNAASAIQMLEGYLQQKGVNVAAGQSSALRKGLRWSVGWPKFKGLGLAKSCIPCAELERLEEVEWEG